MTLYLNDPDVTIHQGDSLTVLRELPSESVHMCVTSPPFYGLRDYGTGEWEGGNADCDHVKTPRGEGPERYSPGGPLIRGGGDFYYQDECGMCGARRVDQQIGLEQTPDEWADRLVQVFREVRRVLRADGTLWLEVGDSYASAFSCARRNIVGEGSPSADTKRPNRLVGDLKEKDLIGAPWLLAFALRADGWWLRSDIIWARPNPMPESVTDRPTKAHSYVFLLAKSRSYYYDADAVREPHIDPERGAHGERIGDASVSPERGVRRLNVDQPGQKRAYNPAGRNRRSVWTIATEPLPFDHYAAYPSKLVEPCVLAGTSERGVCAACGAPWERVMERGELVAAPEARFSADEWDGDQRKGDHTTNSRGLGSLPPNHHYERIDKGWRPTCTCQAATVPATVLDCFLGSGTTAIVSRRLGRRCVGIELNARYAELAASRLAQQSLFTEEVA